MTSATSYHWAWKCRPVVASSGVGARRVKIRGRPPPGMSRRHPSSSCGVGARAGGWPRDALPHPFKVKLGDHFSERVGGWPRDVEHTGHPTAAGANWLGCHANIPRSRPPCNSRLCHDLGNRETLGSEPQRMSLTSVTFGLVANTGTK